MIVVDIVTPTRKIVEGASVSSLVLPGADGELTVLPGHTELLTVLGTGLLAFTQGGTERRFAVSYGFAEVRHDKVLVLAEVAEESKDIDVERAKAAFKRAQESLTGTLSQSQFRKQQLKLQRSIARQQIALGPHN